MQTKRITLKAHGPADLFDLSEHAQDFINEAGARAGRLNIFSVGSTGALIGLPPLPEVRKAFLGWVMDVMPFDIDHRHPGNAFAHLRSTVLRSQMVSVVSGGRLAGPGPVLLENTAGRKSRPIIFTLIEADDRGEKEEPVSIYRQEFTVDTEGWIDMVDISGRVGDIAGEAGVDRGQVAISSVEERAPIITIENEMRLVLDTVDFIKSLASRDGVYDRVTSGHIGTALLGQTVNVPLIEGRPALGTWQQVMLVDLADKGPKRIIVDVIG